LSSWKYHQPFRYTATKAKQVQSASGIGKIDRIEIPEEERPSTSLFLSRNQAAALWRNLPVVAKSYGEKESSAALVF